MSAYVKRFAFLVVMTIAAFTLSEMPWAIPNAYSINDAGENITTPVPTQTPSVGSGKIFGTVENKKGNPVKGVKVTLKGAVTQIKERKKTDESGLFEFANLEQDTYSLSARKTGFKKFKDNIILGDGEVKEVTITLKKIKPSPKPTPRPTPFPY